jgi:hypothetical protein
MSAAPPPPPPTPPPPQDAPANAATASARAATASASVATTSANAAAARVATSTAPADLATAHVDAATAHANAATAHANAATTHANAATAPADAAAAHANTSTAPAAAPPAPPPLRQETTNALNTLNKTPFKKGSTALSVRLGQQRQQLANLQQSKTGVSGEDILAYGEALQNLEGVMPGVTSGVLLAVSGFESGDEIAGWAGIMDTCASAAALVGTIIGAGIGTWLLPGVGTGVGAAVGGIIGGIVGSFFTMIAEILGYYVPQAQTHAENLSKELRAMKVSEVQVEIWGAHKQITVYAMSLHDACTGIDAGRYNPRVMTEIIRGLNPIEGATMKTYWEVIGWLGDSANQKEPRWSTILNAACNAYIALLSAVMRLMATVNSDSMLQRYQRAYEKKKSDPIQGDKEIAQLDELVDVARAKLIAFGWCNNLQRSQLEDMRKAVQNRGTFWGLEAARGEGDFVVRRGIIAGVIDPNVKPTYEQRGHFKKMSITVCTQDQSRANADYQAYAIAMNSRLLYWCISPKLSGKEVTYTNKDGRSPFDPLPPDRAIEDVFAIPGTKPDNSNSAYVYELFEEQAGGKPRSIIELTVRDSAGERIESNRLSFKDHADHPKYKITSVRAVNDPYSYPDDRADGSLQGIWYIVYGGCASGILVHATNLERSSTQNFLQSPFSQPIKGIGVDQDYLWVFSATEFACATHAEVVRALKATPHPKEVKAGDIPWIKSKVNSNWGELAYLYPCDDGTLVASAKDNSATNNSVLNTYHVHCAPYEIDLTRYTISIGEWTKITEQRHADSFEKLPVFCWPAFESLTETLKALEPALSPKSLPRARRTEVWGIDKDKKVYRWNGQTGDKAQFEPVEGQTLTSIGVGEGDVWGLNNKDVYRWNGKSGTQARFDKVEGEFTKIVVVGREVWGINDFGRRQKLSRWSGLTTWTAVGNLHNLKSVAVGRSVGDKRLEVWALAENNEIERWDGADTFLGRFLPAPHNRQFASIEVNGGDVWGIDNNNKEVYKWNGKLGAEARFDGVGGALTSIAADGGEVWGLHNTTVWQRKGAGWVDVKETSLTSIAVGGEEVWGTIDDGTCWRWNGKEFEEVTVIKLTSIAVGR